MVYLTSRGGSTSIWAWLFTDIYLPSIIAAIARGMLSISLPLFLIASNLDPIYVGLGAAAVSIGNMAMDMPGGYLLRVLGEKRLMRISLAVVALSSLGMALLSNPWAVILFATFFGAGRSMWLLSRRYVITYYIPYSYRGRASSFIGMSERLGSFIGPAIVSMIVGYGYQMVFIACSILASIAVIPNIFSREYHPEAVNNREAPRIDVKSHGKEGGEPGILFLATASIANIAIQGVRSSRNILLALVGKHLSLSDSSVSIASSLSGALDVIGSYPAGVIMDRRGRDAAVAISFSIMAIGFALLAFSSSEYMFLIASLVVGLGNGFGSGVLITVGADIGSRMESGRGALFLAIWQFIGDLGSAVFPVSIGLISSLLGARASSIIIASISTLIPPMFRRVGKGLENRPRSF
ncbi:MAG: MFS transporter [Sulfolobales archaeon]